MRLGQEKGAASQARGRRRGGLSTRTLALSERLGGGFVRFRCTAGSIDDCTKTLTLRKGVRTLAAIRDRGYDTGAVLGRLRAQRTPTVIPSCVHRRVQRPLNRALYRERIRIEPLFPAA